MDFMFIDTLILLLKAGTVSLTIFSSLTYLAYYRALKSEILSVDSLLSNSSNLIGKTVKVAGNATGKAFKSFTSPNNVILSIFHKTHRFWGFYTSSKYKLEKIQLKGNLQNLNVLVDKSTQITGTLIYNSSFKAFSGIKKIFESLCQAFLGFNNKLISFSHRSRIDQSESVLFEGSKIVVQGVVGENQNGVYIVPSSICQGVDLNGKRILMRFRNGLKALSMCIMLLGMVIVYYKCIKGEWNIFGKKSDDKEISQAKTGDCIICLSRPKNTLINPCKHIAFCSSCPVVDKCPICRTWIESLSEIAFINNN